MTLEPLGQPLIKAHDRRTKPPICWRSTHVDLVILDVMLPGVDGFALMDYIAPYRHAGHLFNGQSHGGGPGARAAAGRV